MRGFSPGLDREHPGSLTTRLYPPAGGEFDDETNLGISRLTLDQFASGEASDLFVAREYDRDRPIGSHSRFRKIAQRLEHQYDTRFHIEDAAAENFSVFNSRRIQHL